MQAAVTFFDLDKIADSGQCFRWKKLGRRHYRIPAMGRLLTISQPAPDLIEADCTQEAWDQIWQSYFDLDTDYNAIRDAIDPEDHYLRAAAHEAEGIRILRQDLWETMASFIISQNNNIPRIKAIIGRLCGPGEAFPSAAAIAQDKSAAALRQIGLGYRAEYLYEAAVRYAQDGPPQKMAYPDARKHLMDYKGVGGKVADCICLFGLGLKEAFPIDTWIRRITDAHYAGCFPVERYLQSAGVLQQFMFYYERSVVVAMQSK